MSEYIILTPTMIGQGRLRLKVPIINTPIFDSYKMAKLTSTTTIIILNELNWCIVHTLRIRVYR